MSEELNLATTLEERSPDELWTVQFEAFEGPVDLLLNLARDQKLDFAKISILKLAEEYLAYVERARSLRLEIAADYLVMAAWLAYLKSRFLLPKEEQQDNEPSPEQMAEALAFQLRRLEAIQKASLELLAQPQLGQDVFRRGQPEGLVRIIKPQWQDTLLDVLRAYGDIRQRKSAAIYHPPEPYHLFSLEEAFERIAHMFGAKSFASGEWMTLDQFVPPALQQQIATSGKDKLMHRSTMACLFSASLEMARQGKVDVRQDQLFGPLYLRKNEGKAA